MKVDAEDIVGQSFGRWTVLSVAGKKYGQWQYLCKCECGFEAERRRTLLISGETSMCSKCFGASRRTHKIGDEINQWTVIDIVGGRRDCYKCQCKCGSVSMVTGDNLSRGCSKGCPRCASEKRKTGVDGTIWGKVCQMAKDRSIAVEMTMEQAREILEQQEFKCALTGLPIRLPSHHDEYHTPMHTASLDRIDSDGGYTVENVQWVHKDVNRMKNAFSEERFLEVCRQVVRHHDARLAEPSAKSAPSPSDASADAYQIQA